MNKFRLILIIIFLLSTPFISNGFIFGQSSKTAAPQEETLEAVITRVVEEKKIKVKLVHSGISTPPKHRATLRGLGLTRLQQERVLPDTPQVRGMVAKIPHLVTIVEEGI